MPIIPDDRRQYALDRAINYVYGGEKKPSFIDQMVSGYRLENTIGSLIAQDGNLPDGYADSEYNVFSKLTPEEQLNDGFVKMAALADNDVELNAVRDQYKREMSDRENLVGIGGFAAGLMAGVFDPINLIPIGGTAAKAYKSGSILKGALATGAVAAGTATASEIALHQTQLTRTNDESLLNVTGAFLLGSTLGGLSAKFSPQEIAQAGKEIGDGIDGPMVKNAVPSGVGADSVWGDVHVKGEGVKKALSALSFMDPIAKVMTAKSAAARRYGAMLVENPLQLEVRKEMPDGTIAVEAFDGKSVDQIARTRHQMTFGRGMAGYLDQFEALDKSGSKIKRKEFAELVTKEVRNPGATGNEYAKRAADHISRVVYDPIAKELQELNMLGEELDPVTAMRYINRRWNKEAVAGRIDEFEDTVAAWLKETDPDIVDPDELSRQIALRILGTPDGAIRYDAVIREGIEDAAEELPQKVDLDKMEGIQVDEKAYRKGTGESIKTKADAKAVYKRLGKQRKVLQALRDCLGA